MPWPDASQAPAELSLPATEAPQPKPAEQLGMQPAQSERPQPQHEVPQMQPADPRLAHAASNPWLPELSHPESDKSRRQPEPPVPRSAALPQPQPAALPPLPDEVPVLGGPGALPCRLIILLHAGVQ